MASMTLAFVRVQNCNADDFQTRYYYSINRYHTVMAVADMVTQTSSSWAQPIRISYFTGQVKKS